METKHFESLYPETTREKEIGELVEYVREGNSVQLIGLPGVGRSNVFGLLTHNSLIRQKHFPTTNPHIHFVPVDFSEVRNKSQQDVVKLMILSLLDTLRERKMDDVLLHINREFLPKNDADEMITLQGLRQIVEYLSIEKKLILIFLFDRFDEYIPTVTREFFTLLRSLRNKAKYRFSVAFSVSRPLEDTLDPSLMTDFYEHIAGNFVFMRLYDQVDLHFRKTYIEKITGKSLKEEYLHEIIQLTGGHNRLARLGIEAMLAEGESTRDVREILLVKPAIRNSLLEMWEAFTPSEQEYLENLNGDNQAHEYLEKIGVLQGVICMIPLLLDYEKVSSRIATTDEGKYSYDESMKVIKRGEMVVSDTLTRSEFRLMKHFLQHQDVVIDRDEAISIVWKDGATIEGVSEQALDQLIFRLRRKIEDNPNKPSHIQTVKGRGFKFTP